MLHWKIVEKKFAENASVNTSAIKISISIKWNSKIVVDIEIYWYTNWFWKHTVAFLLVISFENFPVSRFAPNNNTNNNFVGVRAKGHNSALDQNIGPKFQDITFK